MTSEWKAERKRLLERCKCECEMCTADPAIETELTVEDTE